MDNKENGVLSHRGLVKYLPISNKEVFEKHAQKGEGEGQNQNGEDIFLKSDLISGIYEGGLKVWDCAFDLVDYVQEGYSADDLKDKCILELGCGQAIPGIFAAMKSLGLDGGMEVDSEVTRASKTQLYLQDYNKEVIESATKKVVGLNLPD